MTYLSQLFIHLSLNYAVEGTGHCFQFLTLTLCLSAIWYYCYAIYAAVEFFSQPQKFDPDFRPPMTVLKPVCGLDIDAYENLASFCRQDYPEYQIVFGVRDQKDPCVEVVQKIIANFPNRDIQLVVNDRTIGANLKVSNLANAATAAKYSILLMADSDIRVGPDYLRRVVQPLRDPMVGVVTCLYRSRIRNWAAALEAIGTSTDFHAGVLVARKLEGVKFALGSTIAIHKTVLEEIGGFLAIADYLGDDFQLGHRPAKAGYDVVLSDYVVDHVLATGSITDLAYHQIRWARGNRFSRPWGYLGLILTHGIVTSLLFLIATVGSKIGWVMLCVTWSTRLALGWVVGVRGLKDPVAKKFLWLIPLSDLLSFTLWCYSFVGNTIEWRGQRLKLTKGGKLVPLTANSSKILSG